MKPKLAVAIEVSPDRETVFRSLVGRSRLVKHADTDSCDALITDSIASAENAAARQQSVLLLQPLRLDSTTVTSLRSSRIMPGQIQRHEPAMRSVKESLTQGKLGTPGLLRIHDWRTSRNTVPVALARCVDLALWFFDESPIVSYAIARPDYLQAHLGFASGGMALIDVASSMPSDGNYSSTSLIGSTGAAYADDHHNLHLKLGPAGRVAVPSSQGEFAVAAMIQAFVKAVAEQESFSQEWDTLENVLRVTGEVRLAADQQQVVHLGGTDVD